MRKDRGAARSRALLAVLVVATAAIAAANLALWMPFVAPITWAITLAVVVFPLHARLAARIRHPSIAAVVSSCIVTVVLALPALYAIALVGEEAVSFAQQLKTRIADAGVSGLVAQDSPLQPLARWLQQKIAEGGYSEQLGGAVMTGARYVASRSFDVTTQVVLTVFFLFYFLRDGDRFRKAAPRVLPLTSEETALLAKHVQQMIHAMVYGTLGVALLQGFLGGLAFWWVGLDSAVLWGGIMALASILPVAGAALVWIPAAAYLALTGSIGDALALVAWGAVVIGLVDNVLKPKLVNEKVHVHTLLVFVAVLGGVVVFGPTGVVLGPIVLALGLGMAEIWRRRLAPDESS
jgi:predicted PurR-regulated permease PerM